MNKKTWKKTIIYIYIYKDFNDETSLLSFAQMNFNTKENKIIMGNNENWNRHIVHKNKKTKNSHKVRRNVKFTKKQNDESL